MSYREGMNCIITPKGVLFSDEERLNPENWPEKVKEGIEKENRAKKVCIKSDVLCRPLGCRSVCNHNKRNEI